MTGVTSRSSGRVSTVACRMKTSRWSRFAAAYASVVLPTPGLPSRRGFIGRSWASITSQAASNWRITSSCPTQVIDNSSGWARCSGTPSISTIILLQCSRAVRNFQAALGSISTAADNEAMPDPKLPPPDPDPQDPWPDPAPLPEPEEPEPDVIDTPLDPLPA